MGPGRLSAQPWCRPKGAGEAVLGLRGHGAFRQAAPQDSQRAARHPRRQAAVGLHLPPAAGSARRGGIRRTGVRRQDTAGLDR